MPTLAIFFGILLDILGIAGFVGTGSKALTALIPALFGTLILFLGILAARNPWLKKHAMHGAAALALIGALGAAARAVPHIPKVCTLEGGHLAAFWMQIAMVVLCLVFLGFCVKSFRDARKAPPSKS